MSINLPRQAEACARCNETHILIESIGKYRYVQASICQCFSLPCTTCQGTGFVLGLDPFQREIAINCPNCTGLQQRINLFNQARIPTRYLFSRLASKDRDNCNVQAFDMLAIVLKTLGKALEAKREHRSMDNDLRGIVLMGSPGTGKTHLMTGFAYQCTIQHQISCIFQGFPELLSELKQGYSEGKSDMELIDPHLQTEVLIIDDIDKGRNTTWELSILDTLISERYNRNQLIMITTEEESTLTERLLTKDRSEDEQLIRDTIHQRVGKRIYSRLKEMCFFVNLQGPDRRRITDP